MKMPKWDAYSSKSLKTIAAWQILVTGTQLANIEAKFPVGMYVTFSLAMIAGHQTVKQLMPQDIAPKDKFKLRVASLWCFLLPAFLSNAIAPIEAPGRPETPATAASEPFITTQNLPK